MFEFEIYQKEFVVVYLLDQLLYKYYKFLHRFHHVHHMNPRVPNYRLQECHDRLAGMHAAPRMSLWQGMKALRFTLWDEAGNRMVRAGDVRRLAGQPAAT